MNVARIMHEPKNNKKLKNHEGNQAKREIFVAYITKT